METFLTPEVLINFFTRRPSEKEQNDNQKRVKKWNSFLEYIKKDTDLFINVDLNETDYRDESNPLKTIITQLTSGRDKSKIIINTESFEVFNNEKFHLIVLDVLGKNVLDYELLGVNTIEMINISNLNNGIYYYQIAGKNTAIKGGKLIISK